MNNGETQNNEHIGTEEGTSLVTHKWARPNLVLEGGHYSPVNYVLGGQNSPVNNVRGDKIHR